MIAKIKIGRDFIGALQYNLDKVESEDRSKCAVILETNFSSLQIDDVKRELDYLTALNPRLKRTTFHTSLNFGKGEILSDEKMLAVAKEYMGGMGFNDNLYVIVRHRDTEHPHCHIVAHRTGLDGKTVSDSNSYLLNDNIVRGLEKKYGLQRVESIYSSKNRNVTKNEIEYMLRTGQPTAKMELEAGVSDALGQAKDIIDFVRRLEQQGIRAYFKQDSRGKPVGILLANRKGIIIPGSKLGKELSLTRILKYFSLSGHPKLVEFATRVNSRNSRFFQKSGTSDLDSERESIGSVRKKVEYALARNNSLEDFVRNLEGDEIHCLFNVAKTGRVTGLSLIYQGKMYKSSDIHRQLSVGKIFNKLNYEQARDSAAVSAANLRTRERFGNEIPRARTRKPLYSEKESGSHFQAGEIWDQKASAAGQFITRNLGQGPSVAGGDIKQSNEVEKPLSSLIDRVGAVITSGYHQDGLNTKRNNRRKNRPKL